MQTYSYMIQHANGAGTGTGDRPTHCHQCKGALPVNPPGHTGGTGYACKDAQPIDYRPQHAEELKPGFRYVRAEAICYACCAVNDRAAMIETGRALLYATGRMFGENAGRYEITNWCGTLRIVATTHKVSPRAGGFGADRMDVWFTGPDGKAWHGVQRGDNQLLRCRRLKERPAPMKVYLRMGSDTLEEAKRYANKRDAIAAYRGTMEELARFGQSIEASLHYASSRKELQEYPDFVLSPGERGSVKVERA